MHRFAQHEWNRLDMDMQFGISDVDVLVSQGSNAQIAPLRLGTHQPMWPQQNCLAMTCIKLVLPQRLLLRLLLPQRLLS